MLETKQISLTPEILTSGINRWGGPVSDFTSLIDRIIVWLLSLKLFELFYFKILFLASNSNSIIHFVTLETCIFSKEIGSLCPLTWCNSVNSFCQGFMIYCMLCIKLFYHNISYHMILSHNIWHVDLCAKELFLQFLMSILSLAISI